MAPEVKTAKNSKLPKMSENCFEPVGKGGWPPISIWIKKTIEGSSSQQSVPQKSGRTKLIKKSEETQAPNEPRTLSVVEKLLVCVVRLKLVEGSSREINERWRRLGTESMEVRESSRQLKQVQLAIVELYQENIDLRKQLAEKTVKTTSSQS
jgi:hypothetical protein